MESRHGQNKLGLQFKGPAEDIEECRQTIARLVSLQLTGTHDLIRSDKIELMQRRIFWLEEKQRESRSLLQHGYNRGGTGENTESTVGPGDRDANYTSSRRETIGAPQSNELLGGETGQPAKGINFYKEQTTCR